MLRGLALSIVAAGLSIGSAHANSEPRCWYGNDRPHCQAPAGTNTTGKSEPANSVSGNEVREFDHDRETTRPY